MCIRDSPDPGLRQLGRQQRQRERGAHAPVSYTHLDVYKRQPPSRRAAGFPGCTRSATGTPAPTATVSSSSFPPFPRPRGSGTFPQKNKPPPPDRGEGSRGTTLLIPPGEGHLGCRITAATRAAPRRLLGSGCAGCPAAELPLSSARFGCMSGAGFLTAFCAYESIIS